MNLNDIIKLTIASPMILYESLNDVALYYLADKNIKQMEAEDVLGFQDHFLKNMSTDKYPILNLNLSHEKMFISLNDKKLKREVVINTSNTLATHSYISEELSSGETYKCVINFLWDKNKDTFEKIELYSKINNKLDAGLSFILLNLPPNQKDLDKLVGEGARYHELSNRIMHERQIDLKYANDQYFLLDSRKVGDETYGAFASKIDTNPVYRGILSMIFKN